MRSIAALLTGRREIPPTSRGFAQVVSLPPDPPRNASGNLVLTTDDCDVFPIDDEDYDVFLMISKSEQASRLRHPAFGPNDGVHFTIVIVEDPTLGKGNNGEPVVYRPAESAVVCPGMRAWFRRGRAEGRRGGAAPGRRHDNGGVESSAVLVTERGDDPPRPAPEPGSGEFPFRR